MMNDILTHQALVNLQKNFAPHRDTQAFRDEIKDFRDFIEVLNQEIREFHEQNKAFRDLFEDCRPAVIETAQLRPEAHEAFEAFTRALTGIRLVLEESHRRTVWLLGSVLALGAVGVGIEVFAVWFR